MRSKTKPIATYLYAFLRAWRRLAWKSCYTYYIKLLVSNSLWKILELQVFKELRPPPTSPPPPPPPSAFRNPDHDKAMQLCRFSDIVFPLLADFRCIRLAIYLHGGGNIAWRTTCGLPSEVSPQHGSSEKIIHCNGYTSCSVFMWLILQTNGDNYSLHTLLTALLTDIPYRTSHLFRHSCNKFLE